MINALHHVLSFTSVAAFVAVMCQVLSMAT